MWIFWGQSAAEHGRDNSSRQFLEGRARVKETKIELFNTSKKKSKINRDYEFDVDKKFLSVDRQKIDRTRESESRPEAIVPRQTLETDSRE